MGFSIRCNGKIQANFLANPIYAPNIRAPKYTKQILTDKKGETDNSTVLVAEVNQGVTRRQEEKA